MTNFFATIPSIFKRRICLLAIGLVVSTIIPAQEYIFNHLTTKDGLASNFIYCLWQDKKGFLWVGTESGLQRYDGYNFTYPYYNAPNQIPEKPVHQIVSDKWGRMWVRQGKTIGIFNPSTFTFHVVPVHFKRPVSDVYEYELQKDSKGNVYLIVAGYNWFYFSPATFSMEQHAAPFQIADSFGVRKVVDDAKNKVTWVAGSGGLAMYDWQQKKLFTHQNNPAHNVLLKDKRFTHNVTNFYIDSKRRHWIVYWDMTSKRIQQFCYCYDETKGRFTDDTTGIATNIKGYYELDHFTEFADSIVLLYGHNCLQINEGNSFVSLRDSSGESFTIDFSYVSDVLQDREKLLWVATDNGLYNTLATNSLSNHLVLDEQKAPASITSVMQYADTDIWIGTWGRGVLSLGKTIYDYSKVNIYKQKPPDTDYLGVWDMEQNHLDGKVWIGCQGGKLTLYNPSADVTSYLQPAIFKGSTVRQVEEDKEGNMWFGCQNGLLVKWNYHKNIGDTNFIQVAKLNAIINSLFIDKRNKLWISTEGQGLLVYDAATNNLEKQYLEGHGNGSLSGNHLRNVVQLNDSIYGIAGDVLNILNINSNEITTTTAFSDLPLGNILAVQTDNDGQFWVSTVSGIFKYNNYANTYIKYTQWDGLITIYNSKFVLETTAKLNNGNIVFAGNQNLVSFNPAQFRMRQSPPDVSITGFELFNDYLPVDSLLGLKQIKLAHNENSLTIGFAALSFMQIRKLTYYYMLEGADKDWIQAEQLQATYTLLPPGSYTFKVRAQNEEGIFSDNITTLHIVITPSFWQSVWFYMLLALSMAGLLYYLHHLRIQRLLHVEKVRTRLARDLHDDMGSTLSTINILSNMALKKADTDHNTAKEYISRISNNSSRMMEAMDDIVWSINPVNDNMRKVAARMKEFAGNSLEAQDINYTFHIDEDAKDLGFDMETRRGIFLIFKEAINNILKYAKCTEVSISMQVQKKCFVITIADNGVGFDPNKQVAAHRGNGLKNMQKRAEGMHGGKLSIETAIGKGTTLVLKIPL
ncbi:hypothetical protein FC093_11365 [Ilyomonas limi]|uniref:Histidine kinase domain-containing protein n=1 Tax=Ilyomonas limi TaxID=2575867 RepID=A0A4U3L3R6_9BACT|nr:two-component regulator propeller domain-containing protein [Ilyomonas limi]TKK68226.1 hypothetical protein FC093_11365 [Ilyomonas limi]